MPLTHDDPDQYETGDQTVDGEPGELLPGEPEAGHPREVEAGEPGGGGGRDVLLQRAQHDHRRRGVHHVVEGHEELVEYILGGARVSRGQKQTVLSRCRVVFSIIFCNCLADRTVRLKVSKPQNTSTSSKRWINTNSFYFKSLFVICRKILNLCLINEHDIYMRLEV